MDEYVRSQNDKKLLCHFSFNSCWVGLLCFVVVLSTVLQRVAYRQLKRSLWILFNVFFFEWLTSDQSAKICVTLTATSVFRTLKLNAYVQEKEKLHICLWGVVSEHLWAVTYKREDVWLAAVHSSDVLHGEDIDWQSIKKKLHLFLFKTM